MELYVPLEGPRDVSRWAGGQMRYPAAEGFGPSVLLKQGKEVQRGE
jgi:hypothetical protein